MSITYVTAFLDINRVSNVPIIKYENYFAWIKQLLAINISVYFITTSEIYKRLQYTPRANLKFHLINDLNEISPFDKLEQVTACLKSYVTNLPEKDTPKFVCLTHSKFTCLKIAMEANPFGSTHYAWIDAGICKVAKRPEEVLAITPPDKIRCCMLNYINSVETSIPSFVFQCHYKIAGGFFIGPKALINKLCDLVINTGNAHLAAGIYGLEQEYLAIAYRLMTDDFHLYYGDFCDIITNYHQAHGTFWLIERIFNHAFGDNDFVDARKVARYLLDSPLYSGNRAFLQNVLVRDTVKS